MNTGNVIEYTEALPFELQADAMIASGTMPALFQPTTTLDGNLLIDGGTFQNLNLQAAIDRCRETNEDEDIIIDVLACQEKTLTVPEYQREKYFNVWNIHKQVD